MNNRHAISWKIQVLRQIFASLIRRIFRYALLSVWCIFALGHTPIVWNMKSKTIEKWKHEQSRKQKYKIASLSHTQLPWIFLKCVIEKESQIQGQMLFHWCLWNFKELTLLPSVLKHFIVRRRDASMHALGNEKRTTTSEIYRYKSIVSTCRCRHSTPWNGKVCNPLQNRKQLLIISIHVGCHFTWHVPKDLSVNLNVFAACLHLYSLLGASAWERVCVCTVFVVIFCRSFFSVLV